MEQSGIGNDAQLNYTLLFQLSYHVYPLTNLMPKDTWLSYTFLTQIDIIDVEIWVPQM